MNIDRIKRDIILSEGIRHTAYKDTLNNWTIGVGLTKRRELKTIVISFFLMS